MRILNRHHLKSWPPGAVYVGRGTSLGNPFRIGEDGDREAVCDRYDAWLRAKVAQADPAILTALRGLHADSDLVCSCAPARCHATSIAEVWQRLQDGGLPSRQRSMAYAGIGSRRTPPDMLNRMTQAAQRLARLGYTLRSGGADGADSAFERGAGTKEIYLPWKGFNGNRSALYEPAPEAFEVAAAMHPAWSRLAPPVQRLHARNSHQVLGANLRSPVDFVLCWTPGVGAESEADRTPDTGGTGQAIALASRWNIPVFNLARPDAGERLRDWIKANPPPGCARIGSGSILDSPAQVIVNPVNCRGVMGRGLALAFKQRYPDMFNEYARACRSGALRPGQVHAWRDGVGRWVVNFPTKEDWREPSRMEYLESGLTSLVQWVRDHDIASIAVPALGCGLGGLAWSEVRPRIEVAFAGAGPQCVLWLYPPGPSDQGPGTPRH